MNDQRLAELEEWCETHPCPHDCDGCESYEICMEAAIRLFLEPQGLVVDDGTGDDDGQA